jgi:hypothetical protein
MAAWLVLALATAACASTAAPAGSLPGAPTPVSASQQSVELRVGGSVQVEGTRVTLTFATVADDSRCPVGVSCVWEGDAAIELRAEADGEKPETVRLHTSDRFPREARVHGVTVTLERLEPQPTADGPVAPAAYRVALRLDAR